ncbi:MAG: NADH:flavin oxidoreductase [Alphaproteobacteria bacterium]|jgi:2,4-dienoyl-CoA reductase-like NADH-dependent reductase (Old Yellow Enzyme family)|nr:12-oxophytodienoate reductase [Rhodospirillaceae bacterium]MDP6021447.1 NADH:flavin oxidoreductase [Alphaproteobacteria bacterium]MDP6256904.1 NADH:flavin oxidoreductase [Alphaproteobacteria bacterium]MDP7056656.1 NADH:flavin oxidoreductase [Alphaproteobacteria bacterium]MDP7230373.1 NADH:flavin oxidoreductase [Alphaproteobacteria bacterium]|tara:strand:+ start:1854 stop:2942 length:1089 start_codon:yes stop_codon:yes gene_type:complete
MSANVEILFEPFTVKGVTLPNRIVMAPMTRRKSPGNVPGADVAAYYRRRAEGGVGLIITEGTFINHKAANGYDSVPDIYNPAALDGWKHVIEEAHAGGAKIIPQLWHVGAQRVKGTEPDREVPGYAPSAVATGERDVPIAMSKDDIKDCITAFTEAAVNAREVGFDGIEVHGAHGYLIDQFYWERSNQRTDEYGGSFENRNRFGKEIVESIRAAVGPDFLIVYRFSQWKSDDYEAKIAKTPEELERFLKTLTDAGVDVFHASTRRFWEPEFEGSDLNLAGWCKKLTGKPAITVGSIGLDDPSWAGANSTDVDVLVKRMEKGEFDLAAVGRQLLSEAEWANKIREGRYQEIEPYTKKSLSGLN